MTQEGKRRVLTLRSPALWVYIGLSVTVSLTAAYIVGILTAEASSDMALRALFTALLGIILGLGEYAIFSDRRR